MSRFEMLEKLVENLGESEALNALVNALSDDEMKENFDYICRMYDIENEEEGEDD